MPSVHSGIFAAHCSAPVFVHGVYGSGPREWPLQVLQPIAHPAENQKHA